MEGIKCTLNISIYLQSGPVLYMHFTLHSLVYCCVCVSVSG